MPRQEEFVTYPFNIPIEPIHQAGHSILGVELDLLFNQCRSQGDRHVQLHAIAGCTVGAGEDGSDASKILEAAGPSGAIGSRLAHIEKNPVGAGKLVWIDDDVRGPFETRVRLCKR